MLASLLTLALLTSAACTVLGVAPGSFARYRAATPATCGVAIEVPLIVFVAVSLVCHADVMLDPGANRSTHVPKFENDDRTSPLVELPTVSAWETRAGEELQASALLLPAAIAYVTPAVTERRTASSSAVDAPPPRLMLATAGRMRLAVTQSIPAMTPDVLPEPPQSSTRDRK